MLLISGTGDGYIGSEIGFGSAVEVDRFARRIAPYLVAHRTAIKGSAYICGSVVVVVRNGESRVLLAAMPLCYFFFSELMSTDDTSFLTRVRRLAILEFDVLLISLFFLTVCYGVVPRHYSAIRG